MSSIGGHINTITPHNTTSKNATGMAVSSFLVEVDKVTEAMMNEWKTTVSGSLRPPL